MLSAYHILLQICANFTQTFEYYDILFSLIMVYNNKKEKSFPEVAYDIKGNSGRSRRVHFHRIQSREQPAA